MILLAIWIVWEAIHRLMEPVEVMGGLLMVVAVAGLVVNIIAFLVLHGGAKDDLNMRGALWHVAGDMLGSVAAIAAAAIIMATGWMAADPILIERPLVETDKGVRLCRPQDTVLEIL